MNNIVSAPTRKRWNVAAALYYTVDHLVHYQIYTLLSVPACTHTHTHTHTYTDVSSHALLIQMGPLTHTKCCKAAAVTHTATILYVYDLKRSHPFCCS